MVCPLLFCDKGIVVFHIFYYYIAICVLMSTHTNWKKKVKNQFYSVWIRLCWWEIYLQMIRSKLNALEYFLSLPDTDCSCPVPCKRVRYEPNLSYAQLSRINVERLVLRDEQSRKRLQVGSSTYLKEKWADCRSVTFKWETSYKRFKNRRSIFFKYQLPWWLGAWRVCFVQPGHHPSFVLFLGLLILCLTPSVWYLNMPLSWIPFNCRISFQTKFYKAVKTAQRSVQEIVKRDEAQMQKILGTSTYITQVLEGYSSRVQSTTSLAKASRVPDLTSGDILMVSSLIIHFCFHCLIVKATNKILEITG